MKELTEEQKQIVEKEIRKEIKKTKTFFMQDEIDKSVFQILELINNEVKNKTEIKVEKFNNLEEVIESIPSEVFKYMGIKEIKQFLSIDNIQYFQDSFYINLFGKEKIIVHGVLYLFEKYPLIFNNCIFDNEKDIPITLKQIQKLSFLNCIFRQKINLNFQECLDVFQMDNCVFEKQCKIQGTFKDKVYFDNSHFYNYVDFSKCEFEKTASFYEVKFEKIPNFSQVIFKGNLNVVNTNLNFDFKNLEKKINQEYDFYEKARVEYEKARVEKETGILYPEKSLDKFANDFRDSFRIFKNALIKDNNLLDASNFHKCELYCKEIELKQSWNKLKNVTTDEDIKQNNRNHSQLVDFLLLGFYRKLCDHHTDLLRVFNNLILLIALYALFVFGFTWLHDDKLKDTKAILTLFGFFDKFKFYFNIGVAVCMSFGLILLLYKIDKNFIKSFKIFQCLPYIKKWLLKVFKKEIFIKLFSRLKIIILDLCHLMESLVIALLIPCVFYILFAIFGLFLNLDKDFKYLLFVNSLFVSTYICLVYTKSLFLGRYVVLILSYVVFFIMLISQPSIIHPLIGKIMGDFDKNLSYPSLLILNILYTILMALVLFSLQKTARKNSIVPS
ncbi:pentapeptide repeat-containing protein [Campylobacter sp. RM3125]|uniref:pentapeptide repeat-containing protein n=1 Tax=Campylobacter molothri TaxID=1032242 RepID=UPI00301D0772|nr:pentapeptide repeat-containing protein [Campylobacter sp. RM3125]MBZ7971191.1 pentapeptide repeat-containing protein [Campylobacter sp. RM3124]